MLQRDPPHRRRREVGVGHLVRHADREREVGEVAVRRRLVAVEVDAAAWVLVVLLAVAQREDGVHDRPRQQHAHDGEGRVQGFGPTTHLRCLHEQHGDGHEARGARDEQRDLGGDARLVDPCGVRRRDVGVLVQQPTPDAGEVDERPDRPRGHHRDLPRREPRGDRQDDGGDGGRAAHAGERRRHGTILSPRSSAPGRAG